MSRKIDYIRVEITPMSMMRARELRIDVIGDVPDGRISCVEVIGEDDFQAMFDRVWDRAKVEIDKLVKEGKK